MVQNYTISFTTFILTARYVAQGISDVQRGIWYSEGNMKLCSTSRGKVSTNQMMVLLSIFTCNGIIWFALHGKNIPYLIPPVPVVFVIYVFVNVCPCLSFCLPSFRPFFIFNWNSYPDIFCVVMVIYRSERWF